MANEIDYDDILNTQWDDLPQAALLPEGDWLLAGRNVVVMKPREEGQTPRVIFFFSVKEPVSVDEDDLAELGADYDPSANEVTKQVYIEGPRSWEEVRGILSKCGIDTAGQAIGDSFKAFRGAEVIAHLNQASYQRNGETQYENRPVRFSPVEE